jgi:hypothetical protein
MVKTERLNPCTVSVHLQVADSCVTSYYFYNNKLKSYILASCFSTNDKKLSYTVYVKSIAVPLHAMEALGGRGGIAPTHSRPRH